MQDRKTVSEKALHIIEEEFAIDRHARRRHTLRNRRPPRLPYMRRESLLELSQGDF
jgi:hypothetical protein